MKCDSCSYAVVRILWTSCLLRDNRLCSTFAEGCDTYKPITGTEVDLGTYLQLYQQWARKEMADYDVILNSYF
jgi:hypothetical protein